MSKFLPVSLGVFVGGILPLSLGVILANHKCIFYTTGCLPSFACTPGGTCQGGALSKKGQGVLYGGCVSRNNFNCTEQTVNCFVEIYYELVDCEVVCGTSYATTTGCN